jgi:hypothetical protein
MAARSHSAAYEIVTQFIVSFKKIGLIKLWLDMTTKAVTFSL